MRLIYTILIYIAAPIVALVKLLRGSLGVGELRNRWGLAGTPAKADGVHRVSIWVHAVSVGEVQAGAVLIRALLKREPAAALIVTTGTKTGAERVRALFGDSVRHAYLPYDMPGAVNRFLTRERPVIGIVLETEIWPNLFRACRALDIPLLLASARLSEKSVRRYTRLGSLARHALEGVTVCAQSAIDAQRFIAIGADPARVDVLGNVKFDMTVDPGARDAGIALRQQFAARPVWIAASTHEGEESAALDAHRLIRRAYPQALLILVPRHPQRFAAVREALLAREVSFVTRSSGQAVESGHEVLLGDTLGELMMFYAAADVAFVGGSLVPIGGHNLLEPAALCLPILTGPHNFNAPDIVQLLLDQQAARLVDSAEQLAQQVELLFAQPSLRGALGERAQALVQRNRGALARLHERIQNTARARN